MAGPFGGSPFRFTLPCVFAKLLMTSAPLSRLIQLHYNYISIFQFVKAFWRRIKIVLIHLLRWPGVEAAEETVKLPHTL